MEDHVIELKDVAAAGVNLSSISGISVDFSETAPGAYGDVAVFLGMVKLLGSAP